jgi:hypothetical protein
MDNLAKLVKDLFFTKSVVDFKKTVLIPSQWAQMCADPENNHWHSPTSKSEYVLTKEDGNWIVYRLSDHWGRVNSCTWTLNEESQNGPFVIGCANLKDFQL